MSQHDYNLANASGPNFRTDANALAAAIATLNAGAVAPTPTFANQLWYDTATGYVKKRDNGNTTWQVLFNIDASGNWTFKPGVNSRNVSLRNATDQIVASLQADTGGDGRIVAEDRNSATRVMLHGPTAGGRIYLDGDESTGKQVAPALVLGPFAMGGLTGQSVPIPAGATSISIPFVAMRFGTAASMIIQVGTSSGLVSAGYNSSSALLTHGSVPSVVNFTTGFIVQMGIAGEFAFGIMHLMTAAGFTRWAQSHAGWFATRTLVGGGDILLASPLTQVAVTAGGALFSSGSSFTVHVGF